MSVLSWDIHFLPRSSAFLPNGLAAVFCDLHRSREPGHFNPNRIHSPHPPNVQLPRSSRRPRFPFRHHGEGHVSDPQKPSLTESRKLHLSFRRTQPTPRSYPCSRTNCTGRIPSQIGQSDSTREAARPRRHALGVCDFFLFWDRVLSAYRVKVSFDFLMNGCHAPTCRR